MKLSDTNLPAPQVKGDLPTKTFDVTQPIIKAGVEKGIGEKVVLNDQQAERLRESGHIA